MSRFEFLWFIQKSEIVCSFSNICKIKPGAFVQFVHVPLMEKEPSIIQIVTPADSIQPSEPIKRMEKIPSETEISEHGHIPLQADHKPVDHFGSFIFKFAIFDLEFIFTTLKNINNKTLLSI
jgi:hypothetical protein